METSSIHIRLNKKLPTNAHIKKQKLPQNYVSNTKHVWQKHVCTSMIEIGIRNYNPNQ